MTSVILGTGMVSPFGLTPQDHVFFLRASAAPPPPSPFVRGDGEALDAYACRWLDRTLPTGARLVALAEAAVDAAREDQTLDRPALFVCTARARPGLAEADQRELEGALSRRLGASEAVSFRGEAGAFEALREADARLTSGKIASVMLVAVDSFISVEWALHRALHPPGPWAGRPLPLSEGAAALHLASPARTRRDRLRAIGTVHRCALSMGASNDDNDEPPDGVAMTAAFRELRLGQVHFSFGQTVVDSLRRREWFLMAARNADAFRQGCAFEGIETHIGAVGAAAGAMNLAYGLGVLRHDAAAFEGQRFEPFVAWAVSADGTRGIASVSLERS